MPELQLARICGYAWPQSWVCPEDFHTKLIIFPFLTGEQTDHLREKYHIYLTGDGRMNMCGLNVHNMDYVAQAFHETVTSTMTPNGVADKEEATTVTVAAGDSKA